MSKLSAKPGRSQSWLPTQVTYGVDCSDVDPEKWTAFGSLTEEPVAKQQRTSEKGAAKSGPLPQ